MVSGETIVLIGDSITRGQVDSATHGMVTGRGLSFAEILQDLRPRDSIRNAGCRGSTTRDWVHPVIEGWNCHLSGAFSLKAKPHLPADLAIIMLGANDAMGYEDPAAIEPDDFRENLEKLIGRTLLETGRVVLLTPTMDPEADSETRRRLESYRAEILELCDTLDRVTCGPDVQKIVAGPQTGLPSLHPNEEGHRRIAHAIDVFLATPATPPSASEPAASGETKPR